MGMPERLLEGVIQLSMALLELLSSMSWAEAVEMEVIWDWSLENQTLLRVKRQEIPSLMKRERKAVRRGLEANKFFLCSRHLMQLSCEKADRHEVGMRWRKRVALIKAAGEQGLCCRRVKSNLQMWDQGGGCPWAQVTHQPRSYCHWEWSWRGAESQLEGKVQEKLDPW